MATLVIAMESELVVATSTFFGEWSAEVRLRSRRLSSVAVDARSPERIYCGTRDAGLWKSDDVGETWAPVATPVPNRDVTAVGVSAMERGFRYGVAYAGTEPTAVYRSNDGGATWIDCRRLQALPSRSEWSFPPRPDTHHVRCIAVDPHHHDHVFVGIEAGALVRSRDAGDTWTDRVPDGPLDTHTLALHDRAPDRLYAAGGDGYFESHSGGDDWQRHMAGLHHPYLWGVAVDPGDPDTVVVSAAAGPAEAHETARAESFLYRRTRGGPWRPVDAGLPAPVGTTVASLVPAAPESGRLFAANNHGVFESTDAGLNWASLGLDWPDRYRDQRIRGLAFSFL